jgi:TolB-like protein
VGRELPAGLLHFHGAFHDDLPSLEHRPGVLQVEDVLARLQHGPRHDQGSTVFAYKSELDAWLARQPAAALPPPPEQEPAASIGVLPFTDMSREKDQEYFCEGITEEIINALSRLKGLRVASRTSTFQFKNATADSREIGRRLRVGTLLEGSMRRSENRLRIAVQLTGAESGFQLWAARYEREMRDIFAIQDEIAQSIVQTLRLTLTADERGVLQKAPTSDVQAYDYYLRGRKFYYHFNRRDVEFTIQLFSRAVELDPESAQAQASRGVALGLYRRDEEAVGAFEAALRLDPNLFEAYYEAFLTKRRKQTTKAAVETSSDEIHGIMERAVERGLERRQAEKLPSLGVDEKALRKRQKGRSAPPAAIMRRPHLRLRREATDRRPSASASGCG